jgi:FAD:protein FMN transferase
MFKKILILLSNLIFLTACQNESTSENLENNTSLFIGNIMTIDYKVIVGLKLNLQQKKQIKEIIQSCFHEINTIYNKWNPESELSYLNRLEANIKVPLSPQLEKLLAITNTIFEITQGRFDPTIEPLQNLWKNALEHGKIPSQKEINEISLSIGWGNIHYENGFFFKKNSLTRLDLSGIAKGYGVDLLVERLNKNGFQNVFVEWGGEVRTSGCHPDKRSWKVFITNLNDSNPGNAIEILSLKDSAIATSGDYLQYWKIESLEGDLTYFHIMDPYSKQPLISSESSIASASVLASSCAMADGLATAVMTFPSLLEAERWTERICKLYPEIKFWLESRQSLKKEISQ